MRLHREMLFLYHLESVLKEMNRFGKTVFDVS